MNSNVKRRRKRKPLFSVTSCFGEKYRATGEELGSGSHSKVMTFVQRNTEKEVAVKIIDKTPGFYSRSRVLKEIETFYLCQGQENILQLIEYFEDQICFYLIFEKIKGGPLLDHIQKRNHFSELEASHVIRDLAKALEFLHNRGIAHRDLKPENVLCVQTDAVSPVKLCDFDLCSKLSHDKKSTTPRLNTPVGSLEYMAPEVLRKFLEDDDFDNEDEDSMATYDKKCDVWSLGVILYILLSGVPPFVGNCGEDCGWNNGDTCSLCQNLLSNSIQEGNISFSGEIWKYISEDAKDLLSKLLEKDVGNRISTRAIGSHPWIVKNNKPVNGQSVPLKTPKILAKQTSLQELSEFAHKAMTIKRGISMNESEKSDSMTVKELRLSKSQMLQKRNKKLRELERQRSEFCSIDESLSEH